MNDNLNNNIHEDDDKYNSNHVDNKYDDNKNN